MDEHHPLIARVLHWGWALAIFLLALSGIYIHEPEWMGFFGALGGMSAARGVHFLMMYLVVFLVIGRIYYALASGDYKELWVRSKDFVDMRLVAAYYVGLLSEKPHWGKYNPGQRIVYSGLVPLLALQAITGFALYLSPAFEWVPWLLGSLVYVRVLHLLLTYAFISIVATHVYLSLLSGWGTLASMLNGREA